MFVACSTKREREGARQLACLTLPGQELERQPGYRSEAAKKAARALGAGGF